MESGLACLGDPKKMGILDDKGNWNTVRHDKHIKNCRKCQKFHEDLARAILEILEDEPQNT